MNIIALCGYPYAGKDTFFDECMPEGSILVSVSAIVRQLSRAQDRAGLQATAHLGPQIAAAVEDEVRAAVDALTLTAVNARANLGKSSVSELAIVINGIRQPEILEHLVAAFPDITIVWLEASEQTRTRRFKNHVQDKDAATASYTDLVAREISLGLGRLETWVKTQPLTIVVDANTDYAFNWQDEE